jgi:hypothetical protein
VLSAWAKNKHSDRVAGGAADGRSGVREGADYAILREIESFAHVIFAGNPAQREFWLEGLCRKFRSDQHFVGNGFGYKADGE